MTTTRVPDAWMAALATAGAYLVLLLALFLLVFVLPYVIFVTG